MRTFLLTLSLIGLLGLSACSNVFYQYEEPKVDLIGLQALPAKGLNPGFRITLKITNPNDRPLPISGLYYEVAIEGHDIASGTFNEGLDLPAYGSKIITSDVQASLLGGLNLVGDLISRPRKQIDYALSAKVSISGFNLPMRISRKGTVQFQP